MRCDVPWDKHQILSNMIIRCPRNWHLRHHLWRTCFWWGDISFHRRRFSTMLFEDLRKYSPAQPLPRSLLLCSWYLCFWSVGPNNYLWAEKMPHKGSRRVLVCLYGIKHYSLPCLLLGMMTLEQRLKRGYLLPGPWNNGDELVKKCYVVSIKGLVVLLQDSYSVLDLLHVDSNYRCFRNRTHILKFCKK